MRKSIREFSPKSYGADAFDVKCKVIFEDGSVGADWKSPEIVIFDERGELFAATYINCPVGSDDIPTQVTSLRSIIALTQHDRCFPMFLLLISFNCEIYQVLLSSADNSIKIPVKPGLGAAGNICQKYLSSNIFIIRKLQ